MGQANSSRKQPRTAIGALRGHRYRLLLRPYALAYRKGEVAFAAGCVAVLVAVFIAELLTPPGEADVGALGVFPLLAAAWTLSGPYALGVAIVAIGLYAITSLTGEVDTFTVLIEVIAYLFLAFLARLYAATLAEILQKKGRRPAPPEPDVTASLFLEPDGEPAKGVESLTQREREVARLAATGRTTREIGELLHIGDRTVESHLGNAYAKLEVRSRLELVQRAPQLKL